MNNKRCKVYNLVEFAQNNGYFYSDHAEYIVRVNELEPIHYAIQRHLNNLRNTYGDDALRDVVILLGLDQAAKKAA